MPTQLDYARREPIIRRPGWFRAAVAFAVAPLVAGTVIFVLWLISRWDWLMLVGYFTILGGLASVALGLACLIGYLWIELLAKEQGSSKLVMRTALILALLVANFPLAVIYTMAAISIDSRFYVTVINNSNVPIQSFVLKDRSQQMDFGDIPSNTTVRRYLHIKGDGSLSFVANGQSPDATSGVIEGYVTGSQGVQATVTFGTDGIKIQSRFQ